MSKLDVNEVAQRQDVNINIASKEHPDERTSRLKREEEEAKHQHQKDFYLFIVTIGVVGLAFLACLFIILSGKYSAETEKTMLALLTLIVGGLVGYLTGKSSK